MDENYQKITLSDDEGNESEFYVIGDVTLDGKTYIGFLPVESDDEEYYLYRVDTDEKGESYYSLIEDDDEFEKAVEKFEEEYWDELDLDGCDCDCEECDCDDCDGDNE